MLDKKLKKSGRFGTTIIICSCKSDFQDKIYGKGKRLANTKYDDKSAKCTICSNIINL